MTINISNSIRNTKKQDPSCVFISCLMIFYETAAANGDTTKRENQQSHRTYSHNTNKEHLKSHLISIFASCALRTAATCDFNNNLFLFFKSLCARTVYLMHSIDCIVLTHVCGFKNGFIQHDIVDSHLPTIRHTQVQFTHIIAGICTLRYNDDCDRFGTCLYFHWLIEKFVIKQNWMLLRALQIGLCAFRKKMFMFIEEKFPEANLMNAGQRFCDLLIAYTHTRQTHVLIEMKK